MTDTHANTRPVDRLFIGYNVLVAAGWLVAAARGGPGSAAVVGIAWAGAHVAALAVPFGARRLRTYSDRGALVAGLYPLVALPWFWGELGTLLPLVHGGAYDATVQRWDLALLGAHVHATWMARSHAQWLVSTMYASYLSFYALLGVMPLMLLASQRVGALEDYVYRIMLTYCACGVIYMLFPVIGPTPIYPPGTPIGQSGFVRLLRHIDSAGDSLGTSFPSSHAAVGVTIVIGAWRWFRPAIAGLLAADAAYMTLAAVYTQNHYAIDVIAGAALAIVLVAVARHSARAVPIVPLILEDQRAGPPHTARWTDEGHRTRDVQTAA
jgi:membrane-associated phospholipid phosphatase